MAVRLKPCFGCPVPKTGNVSCLALRDQMRQRVRCLGLRSATFNCPVLLATFAPGTRVVIEQKYLTEATYYYDGPENAVSRRDVKATFLRQAIKVFLRSLIKPTLTTFAGRHCRRVSETRIAPGFRKRMPFSRIKKFLEEPRRMLCQYGNALDEAGKCDSTECWCATDLRLEEPA